mmetsp:Transcript_9210/g.20385  ORF Transcript_9210/g.20385 Transcript_9210/m.20385 type:complete len:80 (+) Transcript_9210:108-347(+)
MVMAMALERTIRASLGSAQDESCQSASQPTRGQPSNRTRNNSNTISNNNKVSTSNHVRPESTKGKPKNGAEKEEQSVYI